jgi:Flp pilus assembly pilin Flp
MRPLKRVFRLGKNSSGQTMAEYALILATIALVAAALVQSGGTIVNELVGGVSHLLNL